MLKSLLNSATHFHLNLALAMFIAGVLLLSLDQSLTPIWQFERSSFYHNQWQSISHGIVFQSYQQLSINVLALLLIAYFFSNAFKSVWWLIVLIASIMSSAYGVFFYHPDTEILLGLTAGLHGLFIYAVLRTRRSLAWLGLLILKLFIDLNYASLPDFLLGNFLIVAFQPMNFAANIWGIAGGFFLFGIARTLTLITVIIELNKD